MYNGMVDAVKYFEDIGIPIKNGFIDLMALTDNHIQLLKDWEKKTKDDKGIMMPELVDFYRSVFVAISLNSQKNKDGTIRYLFGKGIGIEIALRGIVQDRKVYEHHPKYRPHSDFELYDAKEDVYTHIFQDVFSSQEFYPPTFTKGLMQIPNDFMDKTFEIVNLCGYEVLIPKLELLFLDKFIAKEYTPRDGKYDCELLAERYDLDKKNVYEYLEKFYFIQAINKEREKGKKTKDEFEEFILNGLDSIIEEDDSITFEQAINILNEKIELFKSLSKNSDYHAEGIRVKTFLPLTLKDIEIDTQGRCRLTQDYINRASQKISDVENSIIENRKEEILQQLNDVFEKADKSKKRLADLEYDVL